jgi:hypothetical protein
MRACANGGAHAPWMVGVPNVHPGTHPLSQLSCGVTLRLARLYSQGARAVKDFFHYEG